jgi:hypothetical protein
MGRHLVWYIIPKENMTTDMKPIQSLAIDVYRVSHSYSSPLWVSVYNISEICGGMQTEFTERFPYETYYEIRKHDWLCACKKLQLIKGNCDLEKEYYEDNIIGNTFYDMLAYQESMTILKFIEHALENEDSIIIFEDTL